MSLFQNSVLRNHLKSVDRERTAQAYARYRSVFLPKIENIKTSKEEQYQYGFLEDLFVKVLGYRLYPAPSYDLIAEQKNVSNAKKADGAILKEGEVIAVIELKSTKTRSMDRIVDQAFAYKHNHPNCRYVITSNFAKLRLYVEHSDRYEAFDLFDLDEERFTLLYALLAKENLFADVPLQLKKASKLQEEEISAALYKKYARLRTDLFENILRNNPGYDKHLLLQKTQTILDRMVFIFFAEDRGILKPNTIRAIIDHYRSDIEARELWHFYKIYFRAIDKGNERLGIPAYNGGLFAEDAIIESLVIDAEVIESLPLALSAYDFNTDIDVNILGHIFENSLNDIEEIKARIDDADFDPAQTKRKKEGVFYTPEFITKYIVDNTLGRLCTAQKAALGLDEMEIAIPRNPKKPTKTEQKQKAALEAYRDYLLGLKILDPACGSGAFLNQALGYLLEEHAFIDEGLRTLMGGGVLGLYDVKKGILENNLYGVDINAEAVEIAKLSLWLRTVESGRRLDKLADKIKVGNSLIDDPDVAEDAFVWKEAFPEVFAQGGFDVVIGNPPYVRQELLDAKSKAFFKSRYATYHGTADLYVFFVEKGYSLLKEGGKFSFIFPNKWMRANYGKALREWLSDKHIEEIIDFGDLPVFKEATTYPLILMMKKSDTVGIFQSLQLDTLEFGDLREYVARHHKDTDQTLLSAEGWTLSDQRIQHLMEKLRSVGTPLGEYVNGAIYYGIKTGLNEAFVIDEETKKALIEADPCSAEVIKPFLAGREIKRYETPVAENYLILFPKGFTRSISGLTDEQEAWQWLKSRYLAIAAWLEPFETKGKKRYDKGEFWWELRACDYYEAFEKPKIIVPAIANKASNCLDERRHYSNDKTTIIGSDSKYLLALLNSKVVDFFLKQIASTKQNGYFEYKPMYLEQLPIVNSDDVSGLEESVASIIELHHTFQVKKQTFLGRLSDNLSLDKPTKKIEAFYKHDFKTFLKELKKKKITLSLTQQDEWEAYFNDYKDTLTALQAEIDNTDKEIDATVYALYGLTGEEIAVVEEIV